MAKHEGSTNGNYEQQSEVKGQIVRAQGHVWERESVKIISRFVDGKTYLLKLFCSIWSIAFEDEDYEMAVKKLNGKLYLDDSEKPLEENLAGMFIQF